MIHQRWVQTKLPVIRGHINPHYFYISNCSEDTSTLNVNEKSQNRNKHQKEQTTTETENLRAEIMALKSFVVDLI